MRLLSSKVVHLIAAARPNFMKVAPLYHALARESWCEPRIIHTGQHYDANMSDAFFRDLRLPEPTHHLEVGSGTHAEQTGRTMIAYEAIADLLWTPSPDADANLIREGVGRTLQHEALRPPSIA